MISLIAAHDRNRIVGHRNSLPWHIPEDLLYFKQKTNGKVVVMGRKTYESIGKPLSNRTNIILSSDPSFKAVGCYINNSITDIIDEYESFIESDEEVFVIGGVTIYQQFLPYVDRMYITYIDHEFEGDAYIPAVNLKDWVLTSEEKGIKDEKNPYDYYFRVYDRK